MSRSAAVIALSRRTRPPAAAGVGFTESTFFPEAEDSNEEFGDERERCGERADKAQLVVNDFYAREDPIARQEREPLTICAFVS
jgi:hypothetical protein